MEPGSEAHLDILLSPTQNTNLPISKFWIPDGYVGWLCVEHDVECASPAPVESGTTIFRFTGTNVLETSSQCLRPQPDVGTFPIQQTVLSEIWLRIIETEGASAGLGGGDHRQGSVGKGVSKLRQSH